MKKSLVILFAMSSVAGWGAAQAQESNGGGGIIDSLIHKQTITQPVEPGVIPPYQAPATVEPDAEAPASRADRGTDGLTLHDWYWGQNQPRIALYFIERLGRLPPGWYGNTRFVVSGAHEGSWEESSTHADSLGNSSGRQSESGQLTLGVEHNTEGSGSRARLPGVGLVESLLTQELQGAKFRVVDSGLVERALVAKRGAKGDHEYDALASAASLILEVEFVGIDEPQLLGTLKALGSGQIVALARVPVRGRLDSTSGAKSLARDLVRHLSEAPATAP